jgi:pimeloyl-ACP methyl ester carboxylesterase
VRLASVTTSDGVCEQDFTLGDVPGVLWTPAAGAAGPRPLVLLGHGGGGHKRAPGVLDRARRLVTGCGFAAAAIDMPGFGDRPKTAEDERFVAEIRARRAAGEPVIGEILRYNVALAGRAVPEWRSVLDALLDALLDAGVTGGPVGYWGVSLGSMIGVPLAAAEPRIEAAVFGLAGGHEALTEAAGRITIPVEFLLQWDDELVPRADGLALFDAFASAAKTLHANPGRHNEVPLFELDSTERFFARHLGDRGSLVVLWHE